MRGTPSRSAVSLSSEGIIPAYAGNTRHTLPRAARRGDHPRICGEHLESSTSSFALLGSSPHMRGTRRRPRVKRARPGIIPAYAGNTTVALPFASSATDHPRICGEHYAAMSRCIRRAGSSPHMRGTPVEVFVRTGACGIIPAYAGNTRLSHGTQAVHRDHPRICGEHTAGVETLRDEPGSSPHMRGTLFTRLPFFGRFGIIPAYAGNTLVIRVLL